VTLSNYRWRLGLEKGERKYDSYEQKLATLPNITVQRSPSKAETTVRRIRHRRPMRKFTGKYEHRTFATTGHPPQEDPQDFVNAVVDADKL
jgi:hypothetical protein